MAALLVGLVIESLGSYVEVYWIDHGSSDATVRKVYWNAYLRLAWGSEGEPVGHRYLRRTLTSFKFELNTFIALFFVWAGVAALGVSGLLGGWTIEGLIVLSLVMWGFYQAACDSAEVLASVRALLLDDKPQPVERARQSVEYRDVIR